LKFIRIFPHKLYNTFVAALGHRTPVRFKNVINALSVILIWLKGRKGRKSKCP
jgi:hypothetical protein